MSLAQVQTSVTSLKMPQDEHNGNATLQELGLFFVVKDQKQKRIASVSSEERLEEILKFQSK